MRTVSGTLLAFGIMLVLVGHTADAGVAQHQLLLAKRQARMAVKQMVTKLHNSHAVTSSGRGLPRNSHTRNQKGKAKTHRKGA